MKEEKPLDLTTSFPVPSVSRDSYGVNASDVFGIKEEIKGRSSSSQLMSAYLPQLAPSSLHQPRLPPVAAAHGQVHDMDEVEGATTIPEGKQQYRSTDGRNDRARRHSGEATRQRSRVAGADLWHVAKERGCQARPYECTRYGAPDTADPDHAHNAAPFSYATFNPMQSAVLPGVSLYQHC